MTNQHSEAMIVQSSGKKKQVKKHKLTRESTSDEILAVSGNKKKKNS